jgi:polysaccharide biosynthesis protein VpsQ
MAAEPQLFSSDKFMKWLAIFFGLFIVVIVVLADTRHLGFLYPVYNFPFGDKVGHFFLFGLLSLVVNLNVLVPASGPLVQSQVENKHKVVKASLILALFVGLEELSQRWFPARTSDLFDLSASYLGIAFFAFSALKIKARRPHLK